MTPTDPFDPDNLRLDASAFLAAAQSPRPTRPPRHRPGEWFLRGPVPWRWLEVAARLSGQALALSLCLWREANRRNRRTVRLCLGRMGLGVSEQAARRALRKLERAGLVSVLREGGRGLEITRLEAPPRQAPGQS
jgi:DNA-binding transcriptional ArsR family regulator